MTEKQSRSVLLAVLGATGIWLWWSGEVLNYVRPGLAPWLLASGGDRGSARVAAAALAAAGAGAGGAGRPAGRA
jgi:hypothetical protein